MENEGNTQNSETSSEEVVKTEEIKQDDNGNQGANGQSTEQQDTVDYKKLAEDLEKELGQARFKLKEKNIESKKNKKEEKEDYEDVYDQDSDIDEIVDKKVQAIRQEMSMNLIEEELSSASTDPDEQKLIKLYYENKIVKTGFDRASIKKDIELAQFLANKPRIENITKEIKAKSVSDAGKSNGGGSGSQAIKSDSESGSVTLSDADKRLMQKFGLTEKDIK